MLGHARFSTTILCFITGQSCCLACYADSRPLPTLYLTNAYDADNPNNADLMHEYFLAELVSDASV